MNETSWRRNYGGDVMDGICWRQRHAGGTQEASRKHLGDTQETSRRLRAGTQETPRGTEPRRHWDTRNNFEVKCMKTITLHSENNSMTNQAHKTPIPKIHHQNHYSRSWVEKVHVCIYIFFLFLCLYIHIYIYVCFSFPYRCCPRHMKSNTFSLRILVYLFVFWCCVWNSC